MTDDNFYNEDPNREFNPYVYGEDAEALVDAKKREDADKHLKMQRAAEADGKFLQDSFAQALKEEGLDQQSYAELYNQDPNIVKQSIQTAMRDHTARMRDSRGRYVKQTPGQQPAPQAPQAQRSGLPNLINPPPPAPATGAVTQSLKEKVAKGYTPTEEEILDSIGEMIGGSGSLIR